MEERGKVGKRDGGNTVRGRRLKMDNKCINRFMFPSVFMTNDWPSIFNWLPSSPVSSETHLQQQESFLLGPIPGGVDQFTLKTPNHHIMDDIRNMYWQHFK